MSDRDLDTRSGVSVSASSTIEAQLLVFTDQGSMQPAPWSLQGLVILPVMLLGGALQLIALYRILCLPRGTVRQHGVAMRFFITVVALGSLSFALWVALDVAYLMAKEGRSG